MKYRALNLFFADRETDEIRMSFDEVAAAAGIKLPASAYRYAAWWENDPVHHVQARAWLDAGYRAEQVDMEGQTVTFARPGGVREAGHGFAYEKKPRRSPLFGALKGTFSLDPAWDPAKPALDAAELAEWEESLKRKAALYEEGSRRKSQ
jgi:hypothetical protein